MNFERITHAPNLERVLLKSLDAHAAAGFQSVLLDLAQIADVIDFSPEGINTMARRSIARTCGCRPLGGHAADSHGLGTKAKPDGFIRLKGLRRDGLKDADRRFNKSSCRGV